MQRALDVVGIICRYTLAVLACVWFIKFLSLIGQSADQSQELAGMAFGKAAICGGAAAVWFYRARKAKQVQTLVECTLNARQSPAPVQVDSIPPPIPTDKTQLATPPQTAPILQEINKMICDGCGKESADEFKFCPHCGKAFAPKPSVIESPSPSPEVHSVTNTRTDESQPAKGGLAEAGIRVGTWVFGAFSAVSLLVSIVKGLVPIYLLEAAGWAGAAWYWQGKKTHSDVAKAIVIVLAVLVGIGEVVHIASQAGPKLNIVDDAASGSRSSQNIFDRPSSSAPDYSAAGSADQSQGSVVVGSSSASDIAEIEQKAVSLYKQKRYVDARPLFVQSCDGGEMKACNYLGYLYAKGLGGAHDTKKARDVYQRACDQGTLSSCASLGSLYQDAGNREAARKYFHKACQGGVAEACGLMRGVE